MATQEPMHPCEFDRLFAKNVPHILEEIFFSLDYESFMTCRVVCKAWNQLHSSVLYTTKGQKMLAEKKKIQRKLCKYSEEGNVKEVRNILSSGVSPNFSKAGSLGRTPLIYAALYGREDVVELLLNMGADPNLANPRGYTPLHYASVCSSDQMHYGWFCSVRMLKLLLEAGAVPNKANENGDSPLNWAAWRGCMEKVKLLLDAGAEPNAADKDGETPLYWVAVRGHELTVELLIERGAKLDTANKNGDTPLHKAAVIGHNSVVRCLLHAGADPDATNGVRSTALHFAAMEGHQFVIETLLMYGANPNKENVEGEDPLHLAKEYGRNNAVKILTANQKGGSKAGAMPVAKNEEKPQKGKLCVSMWGVKEEYLL